MTQSLLYTANVSNSTGIVSGSMLPLGSIIRKAGCIDLSGESVLASGKGYYLVVGNFTLTPSVSDAVTVQAYIDGVAVPGARGSFSGAGQHTCPISFIFKNSCPFAGSTIDFRVTTGIDTTTVTQSNAAVVVRKL